VADRGAGHFAGETAKRRHRSYIVNLADAGAGLPDGGLFTPDQFQKASDTAPKKSQSPARGVVEVKPPSDDLRRIARTEQVQRYSA